MVRESEIPSGELEKTIVSLLNHPGQVRAIGKKAKFFGKPDAANVIANDILRLIGPSPRKHPIAEVPREP